MSGRDECKAHQVSHSHYRLAGTIRAFHIPIVAALEKRSIENEEYLPIIRDLDPVQYVSKAAPASLFFQFGERDRFITQDEARQYYDAASEPKKIEMYDDLHAMSSDAVHQDRLAWLIEQLNLAP
jgi:hypothetical protein